MNRWWCFCCVLFLQAGATAGEIRFVKVHPREQALEVSERSPGQTRAVVLIHGLLVKFKDDQVAKATLQDWQTPDSPLVGQLAAAADVFALAYGQDAPLDEVCASPQIPAGITRIRGLGYNEVVLIGHSAGGLIARQVVEDYSRCGATKVIQVCSPNGGCALGRSPMVSKSQKPFLTSLTEESRRAVLERRRTKSIPKEIQFVCVLGNGMRGLFSGEEGDGVVACRCQWSEDLQQQGIPVVTVGTVHFLVMRTEPGMRLIVECVQRDHPRWNSAQVTKRKDKLPP